MTGAVGAAGAAPYRLAVAPGRFAKVVRYGAVSIIATALSQSVLLVLYGTSTASAKVSAVVATLVGCVPSYLLNRRWVWGKSGRHSAAREVVPYVVSTLVSLVASTWLTDFSATELAGTSLSHLTRTFCVDGVYVGTFAVLWLAKFALNEVIFGTGRSTAPAPARVPR